MLRSAATRSSAGDPAWASAAASAPIPEATDAVMKPTNAPHGNIRARSRATRACASTSRTLSSHVSATSASRLA